MSAANVLVTGAAGFIGSHLVEACVKRGWNVRALVRYNSKNDWGWLEHSPVRSEIEVVTGDVRDYDAVSAAMAGREIVFHLAALIGIPYSYASPLAYLRTNVEGTYNVLQSARTLGASNILVTSTSETYGSAQYVPMDEKHPSVGQSPYAATKIAADQLALSYHRSFGSPVKVVRPFNTYGPRQSARAIIPTIVSQLLAGQSVLKLGHTFPTRDLTYATDTTAGFLAIAESDRLVGEVTNIGMQEETTIGDLAKAIIRILGVKAEIEEETQRLRPAGSEVTRLFCDSSKLRSVTGWKPEFDLESGLRATIDWIRENPGHIKSSIYNV
jgi:dTDP-glucose 4,6-dehydratase